MMESPFSLTEAYTMQQVKEMIREHLRRMNMQPWVQNQNLPWGQVYLTGGAIASLIQGEEPKDWDFYFEDMHTANRFYDHITKKFPQHIKETNPNYNTGNAVTMEDNSSFIMMIAADPATVKRTFDYAHTTAHYSLMEGKLYISHKTFLAALNKLLIPNNPDMVKEWRRQKFLSRGYKEV